MSSYTFGASRSFSIGSTATQIHLMLKAATGIPATLWQYAISFDGDSATEAKVAVQIVRCSDDGTMDSETGVKMDSQGRAVASSLYHTATVAPAVTEILHNFLAHPQGGIYQPMVQPVIVRPGERIALRTINLGSNTHTARAWMGVTE